MSGGSGDFRYFLINVVGSIASRKEHFPRILGFLCLSMVPLFERSNVNCEKPKLSCFSRKSSLSISTLHIYPAFAPHFHVI
ncbi:hypothetical protein BDZ45DRAFT_424721 [Acephala macrosclerotiorum]|nr:hypothetical protein BDZ45DRAFT_424721 [Acephala macrosclerotiorum]